MDEIKAINRKILEFFLISVLALVAALLIQYLFSSEKESDKKREKRIEETLRSKEIILRNIFKTVLAGQKSDTPFVSFNGILTESLWRKHGITLFLYRNDSLVYWSNNNVPTNDLYSGKIFSKPFIHYRNGWFRVMESGKENLDAVGLILVKNDFPYQNEYLVNDFQKDFKVQPESTIDTVPGPVNIYTEKGQFLFSVHPDEHNTSMPKTDFLVFILLIICFISIILTLFYLYKTIGFLKDKPFILLLAFIIDAIIIRFGLLYFEIPHFLYKTDLFSPYYYATSVISPSIGDLVVNSIFWLLLAWIFYDKFNFYIEKLKNRAKSIASILIMAASAGLFYLLICTMRRMVIDSNIELNLNNIFNVDIYSGLGFFAITCLILAFFLVTSRLCFSICKSSLNTNVYILIALLVSLLTIPVFSRNQDDITAYVYPALLLVYLLSFLYFKWRPAGFLNISGLLFYIVLFSVISTFVLDYYHDIKEKESRKILAAELLSKRDPLMEFEFEKVKNQIQSDSTLINLLNKSNEDKETDNRIVSYLTEQYFQNYWSKYEVLITECKPQESLNIQPEGYIMNCYDYFNGLFKAQGTEMVSPGLYFISDKMENNNYIAELTFTGNPDIPEDSTKIFVEFFYKYISESGLGYPDLLIDYKVKTISGLEDYSYAKYNHGKLIYKNGDFSYHLGLKTYDKEGANNYFIDNEGYNHFVTKEKNGNTLIISKKNTTWLDLIAPFSYLFIIFSFGLLVFLLGYAASGGFQHIEFTFSNQLQISIISIVIISFLVLGMISRSNIIHLYNNKNRDNLSEKTFSVLTEMEHKLGDLPALHSDLDEYISELLYKFSIVFYSDINLFDPQGNLIASSRPQIFDEELLSSKINTTAYYHLAFDQSLLYIHNEQIGKQEYLSAYIPFRNNNDRIIAYINLPYFAKQSELKKEIGDFLATYINVYVLLIVLAIMAAILVSRIVTRPLQIIRDKLRDIGLGKPNEKISWKRKDEIGNLVEEYNRMIDELAVSAEMLARSERESAWREMAQQVAHEIKNPLTPMKLSVQYLQKTWDEKTPGWEKHLERFTKTIVEQIDSLSEIASEFSDFAKMPVANIEKIELTGIVKSAADLYRHHQNIRINISNPEQELFVMADKRQLLRAFNNLVQNAVQAIGKKQDGEIRIEISSTDSIHKVAITDNGAGISDEQAEKIFLPSFTTKSSGMGLGLAMVRSILASIRGDVTFESRPGEGTTFIVTIPAGGEE